MKAIYYIISVSLLLAACGGRGERAVTESEQVEVSSEKLIKTTPVKNQGASSLCWIYAMLATIESEHLMLGDSVNLSPTYLARQFLTEQADRYYLSKGKSSLSLRGMAPMTLRLIQRYGAHPYDYYHGKEKVNYNVLLRKVRIMADAAIARRSGIEAFRGQLNALLDEELGFMPRYVHMLGAEYTSLEFGRSVCRDDEYHALTSFTHHPFGEPFVMEVPDNQMGDEYMNVPIDTLMNAIRHAVGQGHPICWEGDISEPGFNWERGIAEVSRQEAAACRRGTAQQLRQQQFETFRTTDDHCMAIIGTTKRDGKTYFVCKNSWGKNALSGRMLLSEDYVRLKTIAVIIGDEGMNE